MSFQLLTFLSCLCAVQALRSPYQPYTILKENKEPANSLESCDLSSCDANCRRAGYPLGVCLLNTCFCVNSRGMVTANTEQGELDKSSSLNSCDYSTCNSQCIQHGYPYGGMCFNGGCYCIRREGDSFELLTLPVALDKSSSLNSCDNLTCDSQCKQHGYPYGGICFNGGCYCIRREGDSFGLLTLPVFKTKTCRHRSCSLYCQIAGFRRGICWFGMCFCFPNEMAYNLQEGLDSSNSLGTCSDSSCDSTCRSHGYPRGVCIYDKCYCVLTSETGFTLKNIQGLTDSSKNEDLFTNNCQDEECDQLCNMSGVNGGLCVRGQCSCFQVKGRNMIGMLSPQSCTFFTCMRSCVALNYATGMCESTIGCRCY